MSEPFIGLTRATALELWELLRFHYINPTKHPNVSRLLSRIEVRLSREREEEDSCQPVPFA